MRNKCSGCDGAVKSELLKFKKTAVNHVKVRTIRNIEPKITKAENAKATIYARGNCSGCTGPGVAVSVIVQGTTTKEVVKHFRETTINRMELFAVILGLQEFQSLHEVLVISRAKYVTDAFNKGWLEKWKSKGWNVSGTKELANRDLWMRLDDLVSGRIVQFEWAGEVPHPCMVRAEGLAIAEYANQRRARLTDIKTESI
jgi:ribonuclease HI